MPYVHSETPRRSFQVDSASETSIPEGTRVKLALVSSRLLLQKADATDAAIGTTEEPWASTQHSTDKPVRVFLFRPTQIFYAGTAAIAAGATLAADADGEVITSAGSNVLPYQALQASAASGNDYIEAAYIETPA